MAATTKISWCDHTFNPWVGCERISPACDSCYAATWAKRAGHPELWQGERRRTTRENWKQPLKWDAAARAAGKRVRVFCASLADVFDNAVPAEWRADLFRLIEQCTHLDWLLLTKRIGNAHKMLDQAMHEIHHPQWDAEDWPNVWLGATIANQAEADRDIPKLLATPAQVRFLSCEPLLSAIDLRGLWHHCPTHDFAGGFCIQDCGDWQRLNWIIAGGESGPKARPSHPDWFRGLRNQCAAAGVAFHFKQWGEFLPRTADEADPCLPDVPDSKLYWSDGQKWDRFDGQRGGVELLARVGKKAAGRTLDGVIHDSFPEVGS
jgi:protein gp37